MRLLEKILGVVILIAILMKFNLTPGADLIALLAMLSLAGLYYPLGFLLFNQVRLRHIFKRSAYQHITASKIVIAVVAGIGLSTVVVGSLFKLLVLGGADQMLLFGLIVSAAISIVAVTFLLKNGNPTSKSVLWRIAIIGVIGLILMMTSQLSIIKLQYRNHPNYIKAYQEHTADPSNEELFKKAELERNRIHLTEEEFKKFEESLKEQIAQ